MTPQRLLEHFDRISDAPDAIPRLRRFILDLAVRGKLVEQDPRDEPAAELLKRIQEEKAGLVKAGEIKKLESFEPIEVHEIPFTIPSGWQVIRMGWLARKLGAGSTPLGGKSVYQREGVPFLRSQNVHDDGLRLDDVARVSHSIHERMSGTHLQPNDILLNITGASIGRCALVPGTFLEGNVSQHVAIIRLFLSDIRQFIHLSLTSPFFQMVIDDVQVGVSREGLSMQRLRLFPMLIPPLAEQHRIVAKVDELMALCDRLEAAQAERESWRNRLVVSSLNRLNNGADADAFRDHARFYFNHLPRLTTKPEHIQRLRQTILNLAVRGKLVPQDPNDEPATELISRIQTERTRQAKTGELKQQQALTKTEIIEPPFEIPDSWCWGHMDDCFAVGGGIQKTPDRIPKDHPYPYIGVANVYRGRLDLSVVKQFELFEGDLERFRLLNGDILVVEGNGSPNEIGRCATWSGEITECVHQNHIIRCRPFVLEFTPFILRFLNSLNGIEIMKSLAITSSGLYSLSVGKIRTIRIPIPPLAEQQRIVAKVDELMALCDRLEAQLTTTQTDSRRLLEAVLHEALAPAV